ncbi:MAG: hypothetical protein CMJ50_00105 [Planctomycetaceae bacterium]|nr:hypothetical protein [Planctomycetaceae bacterium]
MSSTDLKPFVLTGQITTLSFEALKDNEKDALIAAWPDTASDATYLSFGNTLYRLEDFTKQENGDYLLHPGNDHLFSSITLTPAGGKDDTLMDISAVYASEAGAMHMAAQPPVSVVLHREENGSLSLAATDMSRPLSIILLEEKDGLQAAVYPADYNPLVVQQTLSTIMEISENN